ncbi:MAG TPA: hypothetical protein VHL34_03715, partial [Rhizomicrobium sp.]|nr:hypothetical protein [Rhizomicrobium sp.]
CRAADPLDGVKLVSGAQQQVLFATQSLDRHDVRDRSIGETDTFAAARMLRSSCFTQLGDTLANWVSSVDRGLKYGGLWHAAIADLSSATRA